MHIKAVRRAAELGVSPRSLLVFKEAGHRQRLDASDSAFLKYKRCRIQTHSTSAPGKSEISGESPPAYRKKTKVRKRKDSLDASVEPPYKKQKFNTLEAEVEEISREEPDLKSKVNLSEIEVEEISCEEDTWKRKVDTLEPVKLETIFEEPEPSYKKTKNAHSQYFT